MIAFLRGRVLEKHPTRVIVETGGVGYEVHVPLSSYSAVGEPGADVALRIHTHVREDALQLFGFATPLELALFDRLVAVSGIGPKLALAVLSGIAPADLVGAIGGGDVARLVSIPGIGRKTAERIVLEMRDKLTGIASATAGAATAGGSDVLNALLALGYNEREAAAAVKQLPADLPLTDAIRQALKQLAKT